MRCWLRDNGLTLTMFALFFVFLVGQSIAGWRQHNDNQMEHRQAPVTYAQYVISGDFVESVFENWESEFLQMGAYVVFTAFLFQRGGAESKDPDHTESVDEDPALHRDDPNAPWPVARGGLALKVYSHSLAIALFMLFFLSFAAHALGGVKAYNEERAQHGEPPMAVTDYLVSSRFWFESLQNWQSEFLSVGVLILLSIWLRERGSPESKPVHRAHEDTGNK